MNQRGEELNNDRPELGGWDDVPLDNAIDLDAVDHDVHIDGILREVHALGLSSMSQRIDVEARLQAIMADERVRRLSASNSDRDGESAPPDAQLKLSWLLMLAAVTFTAVIAVWIAIDPFTHQLTVIVSDVAQALSAFAAGILCLLAARKPPKRRSRESDRMRVGWMLLSLSAFAWSAGQAVWTGMEIGHGGDPPFPSAADIGFLISAALTILGMLSFLAAPVVAGQRAAGLLEWLGITFGLFIVTWSLVLGPTLTTTMGWSRVIGVIYPVADVVAVSIVVLVAARTEGKGLSPFRLIILGVLALAVADSAFIHLSQTGKYATAASFVDLGWIAGYSLIGLAAAHPAQPSASGVANPMGHRRTVLVVTTLLAAMAAFTGGLEFGQTTNYAFIVIVAAFGMLATFLFTQLSAERSMQKIAVDLEALWQDDGLTSSADRAREGLRELVATTSGHLARGAGQVSPRVVEHIGTIQAEVEEITIGVQLLNERLNAMCLATTSGLYMNSSVRPRVSLLRDNYWSMNEDGTPRLPWEPRDRKGPAPV